MKSFFGQWVLLPVILAGLASPTTAFSQPEAMKAIQETYTATSIFRFTDELKENSGMVYYNGLLWTLNDSGGEPVIYGVDSLGVVRVRVMIENATNVDWEDIAQDNRFLYIADTGNNAGNRRNLGIYRVPKTLLPVEGEKVVKAAYMGYSYEDQTEFNQTPHAHTYDCEALIASNDSLYLFTKDWKSERTALYVLHFGNNESVARKRGEFEAEGLITGADVSPDGKLIALSGYAQMNPFVWIFRDFKPVHPFSGKSERINLNSLFMAQTEGITISNDGRIHISCEQTPVFPAQLFGLMKEIRQGDE